MPLLDFNPEGIPARLTGEVIEKYQQRLDTVDALIRHVEESFVYFGNIKADAPKAEVTETYTKPSGQRVELAQIQPEAAPADTTQVADVEKLLQAVDMIHEDIERQKKVGTDQ